MKENCNENENIILYVSLGLHIVHLFIRFAFDFLHHKNINNVNRNHRTIIIKNQLLHEKIDKIHEDIINKLINIIFIV